MASLDEEFDKIKSLDDEFDALPDAAPVTPAVEPNSRGSFFDYLKARFRGEEDAPVDVAALPGVKTVQTPTGAAHLDASGRPVLTPEESQQQMDSTSLRLKQRGLEGALSFLSGGGPMVDEMKGAVEAYSPSKVAADLAGSGDDPFKRYVRERDRARVGVAEATRNASPSVSIKGHEIPLLPVAGAVASSVGAGVPATLAGRLGLGGILGGLGGFWNSEADNAGDLARDTGVGVGAGVLSAGVAEVPGAIARGGVSLMQRGAARQAANDLTAAASDAQSAFGASGSAGGRVNRIINYIDNVEANPQAFDPTTVAYAKALATDADVIAARSRVALNAMKDFRHADAFEKQMAQEASDLMTSIPRRAQAATSSALEAPYSQALLPRVERFGTRAAVGAAGTAVAGATGGAVSAAPGSVQMALNMMRDPRLQFAVGRDVGRSFGVLGNTARASVAGTEAVTANRNAYQTLLERFGISAKSKEELADEAFLKGQTDPALQAGR